MIGFRVAFGLYASLVIVAALTLRGTALAVALVIVLGLAVKTLLDFLRRRMDG